MNKTVNMLEGNIKNVLIALAWPIIMSNLIQTAMGLVDMIWIGKLGSGAVTAIGTASFFLYFAQAFSTLIVTGTGVLVAQSLGKHKVEDTEVYVRNSVILTIIISLIFSVIVYIFAPSFVQFFNLNNVTISATTVSYLRHSLFGVPFLFLVATYVTILTSYGNTKLTFRANAIGLGLNIILDPILIFGLAFFPEMGVIGAAWATNLSRMLIFFLLYRNSRENLSNAKNAKFSMIKVKEVVKMGFPVTVQRILFIVISMFMARIVVQFGTDAIAAQRIGIQIESISYVTIGGLQGAIAAFIGQNYGNHNTQRIKDGYAMSLKLVFVLGLAISLLFIIFPKPIFSIFISEPNVVQHGILYLQAIGYSQLFMCLELLAVGAFNGLGKTQIPAFISTLFTFIRIPLAIYLSNRIGISGVWWSISLTSILKGIILVIWFNRYLHSPKLKVATI